MLQKKLTKAGLTALAITSAIAFSSASNAALTSFSDDFQGAGLDPYAVFSDNGGFTGGYFFAPPSTVGPQISALANDGNGNQYLNFYANYENANVHDRVNCNPCSPNLQESISLFHEMSFTGADTASGDTWFFDFDYASNSAAPITGNTQVSAFIRVFDPAFNLLSESVLDTSSVLVDDVFQAGQLSVTLNPFWTEGVIQIGFNNLTGNYDGSGRLYDNLNFAPAVPVPAAVWLFGSGLLGLVGVARRRKA